jgi:hypothetical protein
MNAKVVFIVEIQASNKMFFYCLLQINSNFSFMLTMICQAKIETCFKYPTCFEKKNRILTNLYS